MVGPKSVICLLRKIVDAHTWSSGTYIAYVRYCKMSRISRIIGDFDISDCDVKSILNIQDWFY